MALQRLFFAITPPDTLQQQLVHWRAQTFHAEAGRPIAAANLHLTLAFLGDVSAGTSQQLQALASRINQPAFDVALDDAGHWPRPGVVWLGCQRPRAACCSWQACCALRPRDMAANNRLSPFIPTSACCVRRPSLSPCRHVAFTGNLRSVSFPFLPQSTRKAGHATARWPVGRYSLNQEPYAFFSRS